MDGWMDGWMREQCQANDEGRNSGCSSATSFVCLLARARIIQANPIHPTRYPIDQSALCLSLTPHQCRARGLCIERSHSAPNKRSTSFKISDNVRRASRPYPILLAVRLVCASDAWLALDRSSEPLTPRARITTTKVIDNPNAPPPKQPTAVEPRTSPSTAAPQPPSSSHGRRRARLGPADKYAYDSPSFRTAIALLISLYDCNKTSYGIRTRIRCRDSRANQAFVSAIDSFA